MAPTMLVWPGAMTITCPFLASSMASLGGARYGKSGDDAAVARILP